MSSEEHLEVIEQGVTVWNEWRRKHPTLRPDLSDADLRGLNLRDADFSDTNLVGVSLLNTDLLFANFARARLNSAHLQNSVLRHTDFQSAQLRGANLNGADLTRAQLSFADFSHADLYGAKLMNAALGHTIIDGAQVRGVDLSGAALVGAVIADIDLREVKGLEEIRHNGPSKLSISTIFRSEGKIPEIFLRGCGVPDTLIVQIPALVTAMQPIQFYSCFISYSGKDEELAQRLHADLQSKGVHCWYAPEDLKIGERFRRRIDEVIRVHDKLLLILSEHSVASSWVEKEVETAMESEDEQNRTILFPVRLDDSVMDVKEGWPADVRRTRHIGDFRLWKEHDEYQKAFTRLLADLKASV